MIEFADPGLQQGDGDRAARATSADEEGPRSFRLGAVVFLRLHEGEAVEHVAVPRPVRIAADDAHHPERLGSLRAGGAVGEGRELVRHRDEDPVHVPRDREARHDGVEVIGRYVHRNADGVEVALREGAGEAPAGTSTYLMGSPMIGNSRVAPLRWLSILIVCPFFVSDGSSCQAPGRYCRTVANSVSGWCLTSVGWVWACLFSWVRSGSRRLRWWGPPAVRRSAHGRLPANRLADASASGGWSD